MDIFSDPQKIPGSLETLLAESFFGTEYIVLLISRLPFEIMKMNESLSFGFHFGKWLHLAAYSLFFLLNQLYELAL